MKQILRPKAIDYNRTFDYVERLEEYADYLEKQIPTITEEMIFKAVAGKCISDDSAREAAKAIKALIETTEK